MTCAYKYLLLLLLLTIITPEAVQAKSIREVLHNLPKEKKVIALNLGIASFITIWGAKQWDYFQTSPTAKSEGWFGRDTGAGGADKLGHAYSSYVLSHVLSATYESWGYEHDDATRYGSLSAFGIQAFMEFGDSFSSKYGFSYEDFIANSVGSAYGYLSWRYPKIRDKVDFRAEYTPSFKSADIFTAYEDYKYLLSLKLNGFEKFRKGPFSYLELQAGYFTRGYHNLTPIDDERTFYIGIGINLSHIAKQNGFKKLGTFLNYYQVPYTYLPAEHDFND